MNLEEKNKQLQSQLESQHLTSTVEKTDTNINETRPNKLEKHFERYGKFYALGYLVIRTSVKYTVLFFAVYGLLHFIGYI